MRRLPPTFALPVALTLLVVTSACKDDDPPEPTKVDPATSPGPERLPARTEPSSPDTRADDRAPRPIDVGDRLEGTIAFPNKNADVPYETDWYVFEGVEGQKVTFRVEATRESQLRPMISVLIPGQGSREEWEQVGAKRAADDEPAIALSLELRSAGTRLVAVDDARNVVGDGGAPESPVGGEAFGYRLTVEPEG